MKNSLKFTILLSLGLLSSGKIFNPCELGLILLKENIEYAKLSDWICLAQTMSHSNSSLVLGHDTNSNNNLQYGIFQIANYYFCWDEYKQKNNDCHLNCTDLIDDDLKDDIRCAKLLYRRGSNSFSQWSGANQCQNSPNVLGGCDLLQGQPPIVLTSETNVTLTLQNYSQGGLRCDVSGTPPIKVAWWKNEKRIWYDNQLYAFTSGFDDKNNITHSTIHFVHNITKEGVDRYTCKATNLYGQDEKDFFLRIIDPSKLQESDPNSLKKILISTGATAVVLATIFFVTYKLFIQDYGGLSRKEINVFENGTSSTKGKPESEYMHENIAAQPYNKEFEIREADFRLDREKVLGSGQYGIVYKGTHKGKSVAIKTIKPGAGKIYLTSLLVELKVMIFIKGHPNIVNVIGAYTRGLNKGSVYVVVEYCPMGSLLEYLQQFRERRRSTASTHYVQVDTEFNLNTYTDITKMNNLRNTNICERHMTSWAYQLSSGMEYLASKKVIHGDLACRNILMQDAQTIKITDFGLSRKLYDYATYVKADQEPLPWRWLAIETMRDLKFSTPSDVWSYGITLWEIFSLGQKPYPGLEWSLDLIKRVEDGFRMDKPESASESIYQLMQACWQDLPEQRPTFGMIREKMCQELKKFSAVGGYVELDFLQSQSN